MYAWQWIDQDCFIRQSGRQLRERKNTQEVDWHQQLDWAELCGGTKTNARQTLLERTVDYEMNREKQIERRIYGGPQVPHYFWIKHVQQHEQGKSLYVKKYCVVRQKKLCCATFAQHNIFFHVQQFSKFVLLDMFDSKVVWHLWATIRIERGGEHEFIKVSHHITSQSC